jgi:hypothetical protein
MQTVRVLSTLALKGAVMRLAGQDDALLQFLASPEVAPVLLETGLERP